MDDLKSRLARAVQFFWKTRSQQNLKQGSSTGKRDAGHRAAVTGGGHCNGFANLIREILVANGVKDAHVFHKRDKSGLASIDNQKVFKSGTQLPGYFRPTKDWDLVVTVEGQLLASIEFKSHVGPSFGNNFNNRAEEAIGNAVDLWTAYREGAFKPSSRPWVGYFMILEDSEGSTSPVAVKEPHFKVFPEFVESSYQKRYELFCQRLIRERLYDAACFITSSRDTGLKGEFREPNEELSFSNFVLSLSARAIAISKM